MLGDVTTMKVCAGHFDRVFSTLVSNLPSREHRNAMYRLASCALKPDGRLVFSTHHHGYRQRLRGETKSGRYKQGGIYRYKFTVSECKAELWPYFNVVNARPIQIYFPFARRLRLPLVAQSLFFNVSRCSRALANLFCAPLSDRFVSFNRNCCAETS